MTPKNVDKEGQEVIASIFRNAREHGKDGEFAVLSDAGSKDLTYSEFEDLNSSILGGEKTQVKEL